MTAIPKDWDSMTWPKKDIPLISCRIFLCLSSVRCTQTQNWDPTYDDQISCRNNDAHGMSLYRSGQVLMTYVRANNGWTVNYDRQHTPNLHFGESIRSETTWFYEDELFGFPDSIAYDKNFAGLRSDDIFCRRGYWIIQVQSIVLSEKETLTVRQLRARTSLLWIFLISRRSGDRQGSETKERWENRRRRDYRVLTTIDGWSRIREIRGVRAVVGYERVSLYHRNQSLYLSRSLMRTCLKCSWYNASRFYHNYHPCLYDRDHEYRT